MNFKKYASIYSIFMGISMIGMWIMFYISKQIPEFQTKPIEISLHISAEILTAIMLIIGGIGLNNKQWGYGVYLLSMGMLLYTLIMSPGYFLQKGDIVFVFMFAIFIIIALFFILIALLRKNDFVNTRDTH